ncbi:DoxX family protein [Micromonospora sp. C28SCA-DRY-2]|uniref:DoxX family protein n=1 Tax=Micromonospora sp. C28SCA-DRY-2 TaxID=3059522 RepID=UPI002674D999|nr:DoxX family protein [Micromonospora sp. C28SCA-DRY-2]MDO3703271.1 DoxX family protein [Micromonospora sp. C28SCA-DRY-2]
MSNSRTVVLPASRRSVAVALWVAQAVLALQLAAGGVLKLIGDAAMVDLFAEIGAGQWFRYAVGLVELAGAVGLLIPRLCGLAALGVTALLVGATVTNVALGVAPWLPLVLLLVAAAVAYARRSEIGGLR